MKKLLCALGATMTLTTAMAWPDKAVNVVVPFPPGGSTDTIARTLANAIHRSYLLLTPRCQQLLRWLAPFAGGFDAEAVTALGSYCHVSAQEDAA